VFKLHKFYKYNLKTFCSLITIKFKIQILSLNLLLFKLIQCKTRFVENKRFLTISLLRLLIKSILYCLQTCSTDGSDQYCSDNIISMGNQEGEKQLFNVNLAKIIGLYYILDPGTVRFRSYNVLQVVVTSLMLFLGFMATMMGANGGYYWNNVHVSSLMYLVGTSVIYNVCYKIYVVIRYSGRIWDCLSVVRFDFTKHKRRDGGRLLNVWRNRSIRITYVYVSINIIVLLGIVAIPGMFNHSTVELENRNGSMNNYRINVLNIHLLALSDDAKYNRYFGVFYFFEGMTIAISQILNFIVDMVLITLSLALMCQLQMVCTAFENLGHKKSSGRRTSGIHMFLAQCMYFSL